MSNNVQQLNAMAGGAKVFWKGGRGYLMDNGTELIELGKNFKAARQFLLTQQLQFLENSKGKRVPIELINPADRDRERMINQVFELAEELQVQLIETKQKMYFAIAEFMKKHGGVPEFDVASMEQLHFTDFAAKRQLQIRKAEKIDYNEQLNTALRLLNECVEEWTQGDRPELCSLIQQVVSAGKKGKIDHAMLLRLQRINSTYPKFQKAQQLIAASINTYFAKQYLLIRKRDNAEGKFQTVNLNFSGI